MPKLLRVLKAVWALAAVLTMTNAACAEMIWWDGSREPGNTPPGKLISDNYGYYGDCVLTGVDYVVESDAHAVRRERRRDPSTTTEGQQVTAPRPRLPGSVRYISGAQLLDGKPDTGISAAGPVVVVFDFKRNCTFSEIDICTRTRKVAISIEASGEDDEWRTIFERTIEDCPNAALHRIKLPEQPNGRYIRLTVDGGDSSAIDEFLAWGDAEITTENPEIVNPVIETLPVVDWCAFAIPGIDKMGIVYNEFRDWKALIGDAGELPVMWSQVPTWDGITERPFMPSKDEVNKPVELVMARNETECAAVALTHIGWPDPIDTRVRVGDFRRVKDGMLASGIKGKLRVAGAIPSSIFGVVLGPLFEADNMPGLGVLKRYTTNGEGIHRFPNLNMPAMTSVVLWLSVTADGAQPDIYEAELTCSAKGAEPMKIRVEVLDVTLPDTFAWVVCYSYETRMFPFQYSDRLDREVAYRKSLGLNVYHGFPNEGSLGDVARNAGPVSYLTYGVPGELLSPFQKNIDTEADAKAIEDRVKTLVQQAKSVGLGYDDWALELWDEPNTEGCKAYGRVCEIIHRVEPKLRMYCNPTTNEIGDWYNKHIAVSVPFFKAAFWGEGSPVFETPRPVRSFYVVATNSAKGERSLVLERYRKFAWDAVAKGWNGWGFFAYYRPDADPWNDFDRTGPNASPDFSMVYPGPRGPIATRHSEAVREGYEDYRLMDLLRKQGKNREADAIVRDYKNNLPLTELRLRALKAAARQ